MKNAYDYFKNVKVGKALILDAVYCGGKWVVPSLEEEEAIKDDAKRNVYEYIKEIQDKLARDMFDFYGVDMGTATATEPQPLTLEEMEKIIRQYGSMAGEWRVDPHLWDAYRYQVFRPDPKDFYNPGT